MGANATVVPVVAIGDGAIIASNPHLPLLPVLKCSSNYVMSYLKMISKGL
ncbi:hypothetical protein ACFSFW_10480 [Fredinandcohnia salidurans]|uniref:Uncharacterized protein n=1 Tax=Fredinandcohnia salidurans TaxID=2595041 RepID=A0ABW4MNV1_9BACI